MSRRTQMARRKTAATQAGSPPHAAPVEKGREFRWPGKLALFGLLIGALVFLAYGRMGQAGFIWDDDAHLVNPGLASLGGLWKIWFQPGATQQYYPAVYSLFWLERLLWGYAPLGYHVANMLLHSGVAFLLYRLLRRLLVRGALLAAVAFALHPVCVESVAWVSEEKNTLSAFLFLGSALAYLRFAEARSRRWYVFATLLFTAALLSKTVAATLPACLLVVLWWRKGRLSWRADVWPLCPWFVLGAGAGIFTAWIERVYVGAGAEGFSLTMLQRLLLAGRAPWFYAAKDFWPTDLMFVYPRWSIDPAAPLQYLYPAATLVVIVFLFIMRTHLRGIFVSVLLFVGTLFPALGFVDVYPFRFSFVADHFQYLSLAVALAAAAAGFTIAGASLTPPARRILTTAAFAAVAVLGVLTWRQTAMYSDEGTLWRATLERNPGCWMAYNNLGLVLANEGRQEEAVSLYRKSLGLNPDFSGARTNLGLALLQQGKVDEAIANLKTASASDPKNAETHNDLGMALRAGGRPDQALEEYDLALRIEPDDLGAHFNRGNALLQLGRLEEAVVSYRTALAINPDYEGAHNNLGNALRTLGRYDEAIAQYRMALEIDPSDARARRSLDELLTGRHP